MVLKLANLITINVHQRKIGKTSETKQTCTTCKCLIFGSCTLVGKPGWKGKFLDRMKMFEALSGRHKWNRLVIAFSSPTWLVISRCHLCNIWHVWQRQYLCVCEYMCVSIQCLGAVICCVGNRKCTFTCIETLWHPHTGRLQITDQLLCDCQHVRRENL